MEVEPVVTMAMLGDAHFMLRVYAQFAEFLPFCDLAATCEDEIMDSNATMGNAWCASKRILTAD